MVWCGVVWCGVVWYGGVGVVWGWGTTGTNDGQFSVFFSADKSRKFVVIKEEDLKETTQRDSVGGGGGSKLDWIQRDNK